jgi:chromosomal replication initiation ATPase DnaA
VTAQLPLPLPHEPSFAREDFLAAPENMAALAMIDSWPHWPSPLMLLLGPRGSGKSHLGAIFVGATAAKAVAGGDLATVDTDAATDGSALLIDDADAVGAAEAPLFHLLNFTRQRGTSVLMTARAPPDLWGVATPDLLSRLRLAPIVEIGPPEVSLVEAVLTKLFSDRQLAVEPALVAYIARRLDRSLDAARVVVDALDREALARGKKVTRAMAGEVLERLEEE